MTEAKTEKKAKQTADQQIEALHKKIQQVVEREEKQKARILKNATRGSSADDTRRKILAGAFILSHFPDPKNLIVNKFNFTDSLKRDADRRVFGLAPIVKSVVAADADIRTISVFLNVDISEKDAAKGLGARWDNEKMKWYAPPGVNLALFKKWMV